jgi:(p)ppGpp synthase/HD superfamily hydrolase
MTMIDLAAVIRFAIWVHQDQFRRYNKSPYSLHLARVAGLVAYYTNGDLEAMAGAWLHDGPEDHPTRCSFETIQAMFGQRVADIVRGMTSYSKQVPEYAKLPRAERKEIDRIHMASQPHRVKLIKLIDRLDNISELDASQEPKFAILYCDETVLLVQKALHGTCALLEDQLLNKCKALRMEAQCHLRLIVIGEAK